MTNTASLQSMFRDPSTSSEEPRHRLIDALCKSQTARDLYSTEECLVATGERQEVVHLTRSITLPPVARGGSSKAKISPSPGS